MNNTDRFNLYVPITFLDGEWTVTSALIFVEGMADKSSDYILRDSLDSIQSLYNCSVILFVSQISNF